MLTSYKDLPSLAGRVLQRPTMARHTAHDAVQHLLKIRAGKGLDPNAHVPRAIVRDLEAATKVLFQLFP